MPAVSLTVNGKAVTADVDPRTLLVQFLREHLRLTGTHVGCDTSQCGACVIHLNGIAVKSCTTLVLQADGGNVLTIEGLAAPALDPNGFQGSSCSCSKDGNRRKTPSFGQVWNAGSQIWREIGAVGPGF